MAEATQDSIHSYRGYLVDHNDHIVKRVDLEGISDEQACAVAREILDAESAYPAIEIWDGARLVQRLVVSREQV